jgi:hypothetical protein
MHELAAPCESVTVNSTVVVPSGYGPAGDCVTVIVSPLSGSEEPLLIEAVAVQFAPAATVTFWQLAMGAAFGGFSARL